MSMIQKSFNKLVDDIKMYAHLGSVEGTGFHSLNCPICRKMDRKTGGFSFTSDSIIYNCFRGSCDSSTVYEMGKPIPRKFRALMEALHVTIPPELKLVKSTFQKQISQLDDELFKKHTYTDLEVVPKTKPMTEDHELAHKFLDRAVPLDGILYFTGGEYKGCACIPFYYYDKLIGYQVLTKNGKYITITGGNSHLVAINGGALNENVIVCEGAMDAFCFPSTFGVLHSEISPQQAYLLRGKNVVMLPDKKGNNFIDQFHQYKWGISFPDWGDDCKDLNDAVIKYGVMVVARMIKEATVYDKFKANVMYKAWKWSS